jgi:23S rRNA maturation mini-RNase III
MMLRIIKDRLVELGYPALLGFKDMQPSLILIEDTVEIVKSCQNARSIHITQADDELMIRLNTTGLKPIISTICLSSPTSIEELEKLIHQHFRHRGL